MRSRAKAPILKRFEVSHPEYGKITVDAIDRGGATKCAAAEWGASWGKIAAYCKASLQTPCPRCKRCGYEFGKPGDEEGLCPVCKQAEKISRRELARIKTPDRRPGYRT